MRGIKTAFLIAAIVLISSACVNAEVRGTLNKKFAKHFPRKILVPFVPAYDKFLADIEGLLAGYGIQVIKKKWVSKDDSMCTDTFNMQAFKYERFCFPQVFRPDDKLPENVAETIKKFQFPRSDGLLLIGLDRPAAWIFAAFLDPQSKYDDVAILLYDAESGEWVYKLEFKCTWFLGGGLGPVGICHDSPDEMLRYLKGDLAKKFKAIKFR